MSIIANLKMTGINSTHTRISSKSQHSMTILTVSPQEGHMTHIWRPYHILHFRDTNSVQCPEWNGVEIIHSRTEDKQSGTVFWSKGSLLMVIIYRYSALCTKVI